MQPVSVDKALEELQMIAILLGCALYCCKNKYKHLEVPVLVL